MMGLDKWLWTGSSHRSDHGIYFIEVFLLLEFWSGHICTLYMKQYQEAGARRGGGLDSRGQLDS